MEMRMDSIMPLCVIPFLQVETSKAGPLATWDLSWELNQGGEHNGEQRNRRSVHSKPTCSNDEGRAVVTPLLPVSYSTRTSYLTRST